MYRAATIPHAMKPKTTLIPKAACGDIVNRFPELRARLKLSKMVLGESG
jgi:hypothetical protein